MAFAIEADEGKAPIIVDRMQQHVAVYNQQTIRAYTLVLNVGIAAFDPATGGAIEDLMARAVETRRASRQSRRVSRRLRKEGA